MNVVLRDALDATNPVDLRSAKIAVSNIAWDPADQPAAYALLKQNGVRGLEVAPGMLLSNVRDVFHPTDEEVNRALDTIRAAGLELVSMQSLLFGVEGASLFGSDEQRLQFRKAMQDAMGLAKRFNIPNLVFGSPRQRVIPDGISPQLAERIALQTFLQLGDAAAAAGTVIAVEPNPVGYGTNFLNTLAEADAFVSAVEHPAITVNLDLGAMHMNSDFNLIDSLDASATSRISTSTSVSRDWPPHPQALSQQLVQLLRYHEPATQDGIQSK